MTQNEETNVGDFDEIAAHLSEDRHQQHRALIVESDDGRACELEEVLGVLGYQHDRAANLDAALSLAKAESFCFILLGLKLKAGAESRSAHIEIGRRMTERLRDLLEKTDGLGTEILVITELADSATEVLRLMRLGANDVLRACLNSNEPILEERIARSLRATGRLSHQHCVAGPSNTNRQSAECRSRRDARTTPQLVIEASGRVWYRGVEVPTSPRRGRLHLPPQPLAVLRLLAKHPGEAVKQMQIDEFLINGGLLGDAATNLSAIKYRILEPIRRALTGTEIPIGEVNRLIRRPRGKHVLVLEVDGSVHVS